MANDLKSQKKMDQMSDIGSRDSHAEWRSKN